MQVLHAIGLLFLSGSLGRVEGHGYLAMPPLRGGIAGNDDNGYCPHCGNGGGVCGDGGQWPANSDFLNYGPRTVTSLQAGSIFEFEVYITAHHMGHFELAICNEHVSGELADPQGCFDARKLQRADPPADCVPNDARGDCQPIQAEYPERWYLPPNAGTHTMRFKIPSDLSCASCTMQWRWWTANSCVPAPNYGCFFDLLAAEGWDASEWCGAYCGDCGDYEPGHYSCGEQFRNCADVAITVGGDQEPTTTTAATGSPTTPGTETNSPTTPQATESTAATPPPSGTCVWNRDCDVNAWCNDPVYEDWCPQQGQSCPSPQCILSDTTSLPASSDATTLSDTTASSTPSGSSTTQGQTTTPSSQSCVPIGDCGVLGFCDQALFESYCADAGAQGGACPAPFCQSL